MKRIIVILLILCIGLVGCNSTSTHTGNNGSVINSSSNLTSVSDASNTSDISSNVSGISQSSRLTVSSTRPDPEYFVFSCESLEDFVLWSKTKGTVKVGLNSGADNPLNQTYLNWVKTQNSLLVPKLKEPIKIGRVEPFKKGNGYLMNISLKEDPKGLHDIMWLYIYSLSDDFQNHDIDYITDNWLIPEVYPKKKSATINKGNCVFGEYRYINSIESNQTSTSAWFVKNQYLIYMSVIKYREDFAADWQEEYFDYFDFETVSLT